MLIFYYDYKVDGGVAQLGIAGALGVLGTTS